MLVFIDESGDPGMNSHNPLFVLASVKFDNLDDASTVDNAIRLLKQELSFSQEFRFSSCPDPMKEAFFKELDTNLFRMTAIVIFKDSITNHALRTNPRKFYNYFLKRLIGKTYIQKAEIVIDGQGSRTFRTSLKSYLNESLKGQVVKLEMKDSHRDNLVQLADMVAGAVARAHTKKQNQTDQWQNMLRLSADDIVLFE